MSNEQQIFLGIGSNIDDRYQNLKNGIILLNNHPHIWVTDQSHVYQSSPMYNIDQEIFYNMDSLRKLPEAKYAMDDLMDRTFKAEKNLIDHKQEIIRMTNKIIKNVSMLQVQLTEHYTHDRDQMKKKDS